APAPRPRVRRIAPAERTALVERIAAARAAAGAPQGKHYDYAPDDARRAASATRPAAPALPAADLDKDVIRSSVRALLPMIQECYEEGLERAPSLQGDIVVHFTIDGEPEVGGVIGESSIVTESTTLVDPQVLECVQETMYGIEIEPPSGGGVVEVTYPFRFSTTEE
ncbi:MAG TPA: AgmX/PglI C-terminal domain-containing protein, partial [Kofleriaceae bacterium]|nr:AgmX/PglI C-terminal domain-containing protein [Kofleriaceae bacterium]